MTTKVTVAATHGWPVRVQSVNPETGKDVGAGTIVGDNATHDFYVHSSQDLRIHEIQPGEPDHPDTPGTS